MTSPCSRKALATIIAFGSTIIPFTAALGQSGPRALVDVTASVGGESNPYLQEGSEVAGAAYLAVDPTVFLEEGRNETVLRGGVRLAQYTNDYGSDIAGSARIESRRGLSSDTYLSLFAEAWSSRTRLMDVLTTDAEDMTEVTAPAFSGVIVDPTVTGSSTRQSLVGGGASLEHRLDARSTLDTGISYAKTLIGGGLGSDYAKGGAYLSYGRKISDSTTLSARTQFSTYRYDNSLSGNSRVYTLTGGLSSRLNQYWEWRVQLGADVIDRMLAPAQREQKVALAGSSSICRTLTSSSLCLSAQRSAQPTALAGVTTSTGLGVNYSLRTSARDSLRMEAQYSRAGGDTGLAVVRREIFGASVGFTRQLSQRSSVFVQAGYTGSSRETAGGQSGYSVRSGIRMRFGRYR